MKPCVPATFLLLSPTVPQLSGLQIPNDRREQHHQVSAMVAILDEPHGHTDKNQPWPRQVGRSTSEAVVTATVGTMMI